MKEKREYQVYIVGTPIGNIEDISIRAVNILKNVDEIYCEDTRVSKKLLSYYGINKKLFSYNDFNEDKKSEEIIKKVKLGKKIALISDAGMPVISDPGYKLVKKMIKENIEYTVVGSTSALINALILSGLPPNNFMFVGFLPKKKGKRFEKLSYLLSLNTTIIIYESPYRLDLLIKELYNLNKNIILVVVKETTKLFEKVYRGKVVDFFEGNIKIKKKGEFVVLFNPEIDEI